MIENLNYLKTAIDVLVEGTSEMNQLKILKVVQQICERNIEKIENDLIDRVEGKLFRENDRA